MVFIFILRELTKIVYFYGVQFDVLMHVYIVKWLNQANILITQIVIIFRCGMYLLIAIVCFPSN